MWFHGSYPRSVDGKGRLILPAEVREQLGEAGGTAVWLTMSKDYTVALYTEAKWREKCERLERNKTARTTPYIRILFENTKRVVPDKQGRISLPSNLMEYAGIDADGARDVVITGSMDHFLIWSASTHRSYRDEHLPADTLAAHDAIEFDRVDRGKGTEDAP